MISNRPVAKAGIMLDVVTADLVTMICFEETSRNILREHSTKYIEYVVNKKPHEKVG
jgi:hypothetical protein